MKHWVELINLIVKDHRRPCFTLEGEDVILQSFLKKKGVYINIGVGDPINNNSTYLLYKQGWKGYNIDPTPNTIKKLNFIRPKDVNLLGAVWIGDIQLDFFQFDNPFYNTFSRKIANNTGGEHKMISIERLDVHSLNYFTKDIKEQIDLLCVDINGFDGGILLGNDWSLFKPRHILINTTEEITGHLLFLGYKLIALTKSKSLFSLYETEATSEVSSYLCNR